MNALPGPGQLRDRVQLQRKEHVAEAEGGQAELFVPVATLWARVRVLAVSRTGLADARGVEISHSVVIRHRNGVQPGDRFIYRGRRLEVLDAADLNGNRRFLSCRCRETAVSG